MSDSGSNRRSWLDDDTGSPAIEAYARKLSSFVATMADGWVDAEELAAQEQRVVELMREIEPQLDDALHARVTALLCELTAFDIMQVLGSLQNAKPSMKFRG